jgi:hypothetical protein
MFNKSRAGLLMAAAMGLAGAGMAQQALLPPTRPIVRQSKRQLLRSADGPVIRYGYLKHTGWTNRRYQRAALKAKHQARHRRACRSK